MTEKTQSTEPYLTKNGDEFYVVWEDEKGRIEYISDPISEGAAGAYEDEELIDAALSVANDRNWQIDPAILNWAKQQDILGCFDDEW